jgi:hypothetical protein
VVHVRLPGWENLETAKSIHSFFEIAALVLFAVLVLFEVLAHRKTKKENLFKILALISFAGAIGAEVVAYPYSRRMDELSSAEIATQRLRVAELELKSRPKPYDERLKAFCDSVDGKILQGLRNGTTRFDRWLFQDQLGELRKLAGEPEASQYIRLEYPGLVKPMDRGMATLVTIEINPLLLKR